LVITFPIDASIGYFLGKYNFAYQNIKNRFLYISIENLTNGEITIKKLSMYPFLTKLVIKTDNGKFTIGFDKILSGNFNNLKIGNDIIYKDYTGVANGTIKYDLSKGAILQIDVKGDLSSTTIPFGKMNIKCSGKESFNCTVAADNINGNFSGTLRNNIITGKFSGKVLGMDKKGELVTIGLK
jgi:hypothetical protein